mgnify:CR=1 FL=1
MNKQISLFLLLFALAILSSCGSKDTKKDAWVMPEHEVVTRQMPELSLTDSITVGTRQYTYSILRTPSDSLQKVRDDMGDLYLDNTIRLTLHRNGALYFDKTFTKETFSHNIDEEFYANAILDGIRFLRAEPGQGLIFSFAVSYPDSDMSVPFLMTIADSGSFTFVKDENLDREEADSVFLDNSDGV